MRPPSGRFCAAYAGIAAHLAQAYLCEGRSEEAKAQFHTAIEFEITSQGEKWPSTETSLRLLQGLAVACQKSGHLEEAAETLHSALALSEELYDEMDWRTAAIASHLKAVSERREVVLEHHKSAVIATTDSKRYDESQGTARTQKNASVTMALGAFGTVGNEEGQYRGLELEEEVDYGTELLGASYEGDEGVVKLLLGLEDVNMNLTDEYGRTALSYAAMQGHEAVVRLLVARDDVEADLPDERYGRTPLSYAAIRGHEAVVKLLVARDDIKADLPDGKYGRTPLIHSALNGHEAVVRLLIARDDVRANLQDNGGLTPLIYAAAQGHEEVVKLILACHDVEADLPGNLGVTPLSYAATQGREAVVRLLLARNDVKADSQDKGGRTPLSRAAQNGHEAVVRLLEMCADVDHELPSGRHEGEISSFEVQNEIY